MPRCGLLGKKLGHSYSPEIHAMLGDYEYLLYEKDEDEIASFMREGKWTGINVTIPYKKTVIPYLDGISDMARTIGSVNTVIRRSDGTLWGDTTDVYGFTALVGRSGIEVSGKKTLVLGSGGASAAVCAALGALGADHTIISRTGENNYGNLHLHSDARVIVNTTPVGMYPDNGHSPLDLEAFPRLDGVIDIIYNPPRTALLLQAEELGIPHADGLYMLVAQAKRSAELFTGSAIPDGETDRIEHALSLRMRNIVLVGMPGSGKTSVAEGLSALTGREVIDTDTVIQQKTGMSPERMINEKGEAAFRDTESKVIAETGKLSGRIIATGGGAVLREENYAPLHQNGVIVWIKRDIDALSLEGRPLSEAGRMHEMYEKRRPRYERFADFSADNDSSAEDAAKYIYERVYSDIKG